MHIGFEAKRALHNKSGLGNYARTLIDNFHQKFPQDQVTLFTPRGGQVDWTSPGLIVNNSVKWPSSLWRSWGVTKTVEYKNLDIFHGLSHELPYGSNNKVKRVVTIHDLIAVKKIEHFPLVDCYIYRKKIEHALSISDIVIAISEQTKEDIIDVYSYPADRIKVVYQSCHDDYFHNFQQEKKNYLLYVGAFRERKNVLNLLRAFKYIHEQFPAYKLVLAGDGKQQYKNMMQELIYSLALQQVVEIRLTPTFHQLKELYRNAKIFLYPSIYEGFGIPIIEALNSGTPVVTTKNSCMQEAGGRGGLYVDPYDTISIAEQTCKLLSDPSLYSQLVKAGTDHMSVFSANKTASQLRDVYQLLV